MLPYPSGSTSVAKKNQKIADMPVPNISLIPINVSPCNLFICLPIEHI